MKRPEYGPWKSGLRYIASIEKYRREQGIAFDTNSGLSVALENGKKILKAERNGTLDRLFKSSKSNLYREDAHTIEIVGTALETAMNHPSCPTIMGKICRDPVIRSRCREKSEAKEHIVELKTLGVLCHPQNKLDSLVSYEYCRRKSGKKLDFVVDVADELLGFECKHPYSFNGIARGFDDAKDKFKENRVHGVVIVGATGLVEDPDFYNLEKVPASETEEGLMDYLESIIDKGIIPQVEEIVYKKLYGSGIDGVVFDIDYLAATRRPGRAYYTQVSVNFANILAVDPKVQQFIKSTQTKYDRYYISESYHRLFKVFNLWERARQ